MGPSNDWARNNADIGILRRLRLATAALHREVESVADLPGSIRGRPDYLQLLVRLHGLHAGIEVALDSPRFRPAWPLVGIVIWRHRHAELLARDLERLGLSDFESPKSAPSLLTFGQALGCLYVVEGSSVGGGVLAPVFTAAAVDSPVPSARDGVPGHPHSWQVILDALQRYEQAGCDTNEVLLGARKTYRVVGHQLTTASADRVVAR